MSEPVENVREISRRQAQAIRDFIASKIESNDWGPGQKIPTEKSLVDEFEAARNTVRKALTALEEEGLIVRHVGRGTFVASTDQEDDEDFANCSPADVMEVREALEPAVARLSAVRASSADIARAKWCLDQLAKENSFADHEKYDAELHWTIVNASRNELYKKIFNDINKIRNRAEWKGMKLASLSDEISDAYHREHTEIVEAFANRDAARLSDALSGHLTHVSKNLLKGGR